MQQLLVAASTFDSWLNKASNRWAIVSEDGQQVIVFTSFISFELRSDGRVVSAPVEEGSFASYNKLGSPLEINVTLGFAGTDTELQDALDTLATLQAGTQLIGLVTPNAEYQSLNLEGYNYTRKRENGLGALFVELMLTEVRQVRTQYTNSRLAPRQERGKVQGKKTSLLKMGITPVINWIRS